MKNRINLKLLSVAVCLALIARGACSSRADADTLTWNAAAGGDWSSSVNWSPVDIPEDADTTVFSAVGSGNTNTLDLAGLSLAEMFLEQDTHTTDLNGNTLSMQTLRVVNADSTTGALTFSGNGVVNVTNNVVIGTGNDSKGTVNAGAGVTMNIGTNASSRATLTIGQTGNTTQTNFPSELISNGTFNAYLSALTLGKGNRNIGRLDLTAATGLLDIDGPVQLGAGGGRPRGDLIAGSGMTVNIQAAGLIVASGANVAGSGAAGTSLLDLSNASGALNVTGDLVVGRSRSMSGSVIVGSGVSFTADVNNLAVGHANSNISSTGILDLSAVVGGSLNVKDSVLIGYGDPKPTGTVTLGDTMTFSAGTVSSRASINIGAGDIGSGTFTLGNSTFEAYLTELRVGSTNNAGHNNAQGTLDLSNATGGVLDVAGDVAIGVSAGGTNIGGDVLLANMNATANSLHIGHTISDNTNRGSTLDLTNTTFAVSDEFTLLGIDSTHMGQALITTTTASSGLDFADALSLTVGDFGNIHIDFGTPSNPEEVYWGLRWDGEHLTELEQLFSEGKLTWDDTNLIGGGFGAASIFTSEGVTYVGVNLVPVPEPSSLLLLGLGLVCLRRRKH